MEVNWNIRSGVTIGLSQGVETYLKVTFSHPLRRLNNTDLGFPPLAQTFRHTTALTVYVSVNSE